MESFKELTEWLFECRPPGTTPQIGVADESKRALCWWPGKQRKSPTYRPDPLRVRFYGCTNRAYPSPFLPMTEQMAHLCWCGLDIDGSDNPHLTLDSLIEAVAKVIGPMGSLRTSCGGSGLHVIFRFEHPGSGAATGMAHSATCSRITKAISLPWVEALRDAGVTVCKHDSRMFWLLGGANRWIYKSNFLLPLSAMEAPSGGGSLHIGTEASVSPALSSAEAADVGPFVARWLDALKVRPGPVYVGHVVERLAFLGEKVQTKSGCSGNGQVNGYIDCGPGWISLWSYADGHAIWRINDLDSLLEVPAEEA